MMIFSNVVQRNTVDFHSTSDVIDSVLLPDDRINSLDVSQIQAPSFISFTKYVPTKYWTTVTTTTKIRNISG